MIVSKSKGCLGYPQGYKMERFAKIVTGFYPITIVPNHSMLDVCGSPRYASAATHRQKQFSKPRENK